MPTPSPEDRVRIKNIIEPVDNVQSFWITRYQKEETIGTDGLMTKKDVPYQKEIEWNFKNGFFFFWGGKPYVIRPNETKTYPRFLADHAVDKMVNYIITQKYIKTKKIADDGTPRYNNSILNDVSLKRDLRKKIVLGIEEWVEASNEDFDSILNRQYGGDIDDYSEDTDDKYSYIAPTEELEDLRNAAPKKEEPTDIEPSDDIELEKAREEASALGVKFSKTDTTQSIKSKIIKEMA